MPRTKDLRLIAGTAVQTRAVLLTYASKYRRMFGSQYKRTIMDGTVVSTRKSNSIMQLEHSNQIISKRNQLTIITLETNSSTESDDLNINIPDEINHITSNKPQTFLPPTTTSQDSIAQHFLPINSQTNETTHGRN